MSKFLRSSLNKCICFVLCVITAVVFVGSVICVAFMSEEDFYTESIESLHEGVIASQAYDAGYRFIARTYSTLLSGGGEEIAVYESDTRCFAFDIRDEDDNIVVESDNIDEVQGAEAAVSIVQSVGYAEYGEPLPFYTTRVYIVDSEPLGENTIFYLRLVDLLYTLRYALGIIAGASLIIAVTCFVILMAVSGRRFDTEELCPGVLNGMPSDIFTVLSFSLMILVFLGYYVLFLRNELVGPSIIFGILVAIFAAAVLLGWCMSIAVRLKQKSLLRNTLIFKIIRALWRAVKAIHNFNMNILRSIPLMPKIIIAVIVLGLSEIMAIGIGDEFDNLLIYNFFRFIIVTPFVLYAASVLVKLQRSGKALADGDLSYHTDTERWRFLPSLRKHGENLNSIALGMNAAVEERLKSERMKTELITNVSHDIKTPLTSIINYAELISSEESGNPKIEEYAEVLTRQSDRLKRLIEDLVEASKASTGNLEVNLAPCDASMFVSQAEGEFREKLQVSGLELITKLPDHELKLMADGRRMWRIFDNLMNNICKYAQPDTRVYLSVEQVGNMAEFTFKNISAASLDIDEEELMERFTRGDKSRNGEVEGNGLGLSIARSMAELQNGTLDIRIDGDLFKAILKFPLIS